MRRARVGRIRDWDLMSLRFGEAKSHNVCSKKILCSNVFVSLVFGRFMWVFKHVGKVDRSFDSSVLFSDFFLLLVLLLDGSLK